MIYDDCDHPTLHYAKPGSWGRCLGCGATTPPPTPRSRTKCTPELIADVEEKIRQGGTPSAVARAVGISYATFKRWLELDEEPYIEFADRVEQAQALFRIKCEIAVGAMDPKYALTKGPLRHAPDPWSSGESKQLQITGANGGPFAMAVAQQHRLQLEELNYDELAEFEALCTKLLPHADEGDRSGATAREDLEGEDPPS